MHYAWYPDEWWKQGNGEFLEGCSDDMLEEFLVNSRIHEIHAIQEADDKNAITISGMVIKI